MTKQRLFQICKRLEKSGCIADIGSDHGKLCKYILDQGLCSRAVAVDISRGSLLKAEALKLRYNLNGMDCRLGDGLTALTKAEADIAVIAGLGGMEIIKIISDGRRVDRTDKFVLSPHKNAKELRRYLMTAGYNITSDDVIYDGGKFYDIMTVTAGGGMVLDDYQLEFGVFYDRFTPQLIRRIENKLGNMENAPDNRKKLCEDMLLRARGNI